MNSQQKDNNGFLVVAIVVIGSALTLIGLTLSFLF